MGSFPYLEVEADIVNLSKIGSSDAIAVKSNRQVKASVGSQFSWIRAEVSGEQLVLDWDDNDVETTREAIITLSTSNDLVCKDIRVIQDASGELTINGDLVLRSKEEIASNTYTKTLGNLIVGDVTSIATKAAEASVKTEFGKKIITAAPSDISDRDLVSLTDQIHKVEEGGLAIVNTKVTSLPVELIAGNKIDKVYSEYNSISVLDSGQDLAELKLKELSLKGNKITDISPLAACTTIEYLDISGNDVYDVEPLQSMSGLKKLVLNDLPLTASQLDVLRDVMDVEIVADELRSEESPLPVFGETEIVEVSDTEVQLKVKLVGNTTGVTKTGFYIGMSRNINEMTFHEASNTGGTIVLTYTPETLYNRLYYVRAYASNAKGAAYGELESFGRRVYEGDMTISSNEELSTFQTKMYSHINGSFLLGDVYGNSSNGVHLNDGKFNKYFKEYEFSDLSILKQLMYVRDGLYIGNIGLKDLSVISHIKGLQTLWLKANDITVVPELKAFSELKSLDVSMNKISDYTFLAKAPVLEKLYLGSAEEAAKETNEIASLNGLAEYNSLKYIDLSGLPVHEWQVEDLRKLMPQTEIVFTSGGRDPYIPTVVSSGVNRLEMAAELKGIVTVNGGTPVTEYGFYFGKDKSDMKKVKVGTSIDTGVEFTYEVSIPDKEDYYFSPYAVNSYGESRAEVYDFTFAPIELSKYGTANSYIVTHPGIYVFDASVKGNSLESVGKISSVEIIWETKNTDEVVSKNEIISNVGLMSQFVTFEIPEKFTPGNALIAVKDQSGTILWSWHIWVTDYDPDATAKTYLSGAVMMDRNLGALDERTTSAASYGFLYQWGRKDPLIGSATGGTAFAATYPENIKTYVSYSTGDFLTYSIQHPTVAIGNLVNDNSAWGPEKTMYDPCPPGWRVPDGGPNGVWKGMDWSGISSTGNTKPKGWTINEPYSTPATFYPAPGYTGGDRLELYFPGSALYCWSCTGINSNQAYAMHLFDRIERELNSKKASEFSVRCQMLGMDFNVSTLGLTIVDDSTIDVKGNVTVERNCPISERGVLVSTVTENPNLNNNEMCIRHSSNESGVFVCSVNGIVPGVRYYIRTYAVSDYGVKYGEVIDYIARTSGSGEGFTGDDFKI